MERTEGVGQVSIQGMGRRCEDMVMSQGGKYIREC